MRKIHLILAGSLILSLCGVSSCATAGLTVCVSNPAKQEFECSKNGAKPFPLPYSKSENYIAMPSSDAQTLFSRLKICEDGG